jgi:FixJ family two-component response regulator
MIDVIHVDNSGFFRKVMKIFIAELGLYCEGFENGEDALRAIKTRKASCVITGLELADMSGEDFIRQLLFSAHQMTIIAVTSSGDEERVKRLANMGVKATIQKGGNWKEKLRQYL